MARNPLSKGASAGPGGMRMKHTDNRKRKQQDDQLYAKGKYAGGGLALTPQSSAGWPPVVTSSLNMRSNQIHNLSNPRPGVIGLLDGVNRQYVDALGVQLFKTITTAVANDITANGGTAEDAVNRLAPAITGGVTIKDGDYIYVASVGITAEDVLVGWYIYDSNTPLWRTAGGSGGSGGGPGIVLPRLWYRALHTDAQPVGSQIGDVDLIGEALDTKINAWNGTAWTEILGEKQIKSWIASGSLFQGTLTTTADFAGLPVPGTTNRGFYWTWTGVASTVVSPGDFPNGGGFSATLQVGDWIQSDGTKLIHVPSDLMSKLRWESVGSFRAWADAPFEKDTLVTYNNQMYRANTAIVTGDAAPDAAGTKWTNISPRYGIEDLTDVEPFDPNAVLNDEILQWDGVQKRVEIRHLLMKALEDVTFQRTLSDGDILTYKVTDATTVPKVGHWELGRQSTGGGGGGGMPIGSILTFCSFTAPDNSWLLCQGGTFSPTTYPDLYIALGNSNTLPNLSGQFIRGASNGAQITGFNKHTDVTKLPVSDFIISQSGNHYHSIGAFDQENTDYIQQYHNHTAANPSPQVAHMFLREDPFGGSAAEGSTLEKEMAVTTDGQHTHTMSGGDGETAPKHVYMAYFIKAL